jgi:O-methyltransferase
MKIKAAIKLLLSKDIKLTKSEYDRIFDKYRNYTMIEQSAYLDNLLLADSIKNLKGDIVECGVWRGGMIAGIAELLGSDRKYHLFDSFEGLPEAKDIDGKLALDYQKNTESERYFDNCKAEIHYANEAMQMAGVNFSCYKGWFENTIPSNKTIENIALLRLDGDWYESTYICLEHFYDKVVPGGIIIIDDYLTWDGCSKAVHDFLSKRKSSSKIRFSPIGVVNISKQENS